MIIMNKQLDYSGKMQSSCEKTFYLRSPLYLRRRAERTTLTST